MTTASSLTKEIVERLLVGPSPTRGRTATDLVGHWRLHGELAIPPGPDRQWCEAVAQAVSESGLSGRGGAGFPTGLKWEPMRRHGRSVALVVNAMEGEPASAKDRVLIQRAPHLVLDGADVVATLTGASEVVVCIADHHTAAAEAAARAVDERARAGIGARPVVLRRPPGHYVAGEESALVRWLADGQALPTYHPDKSVPLTLGRHRVLVHNAETLAQVALIARHGAAWFRQAGTAEAPGSTLVTVSGAVRFPGVVEVALGTPVGDIVDRAGAMAEVSAVLVGGYGGTWIDSSQLPTPYAPRSLAAIGAGCGAGVLVALPTTSCGVAETARLVRYLAGESAGQCGPCVFGLPALAEDLERLSRGRSDADVLARLHRRAAQIDGRGACRHPDGVARLVRSALAVFATDVARHMTGEPCARSHRASILTFPSPGEKRGAR